MLMILFQKLEHAHVVHKISYISHDKEDRRTFGYIVSLPEGYHLFAFRAEKNVSVFFNSLPVSMSRICKFQS